MDIALIIISSLTLFIICLFLYFNWTNEKKNKAERDNSINELKNLLTSLQTKMQEIATQQNEKLEGFAEDNNRAKLEANNLKEQIQIELKNILKEIKAPLDLD